MVDARTIAALGMGIPLWHQPYNFIDSYDPRNPNTRLAKSEHFTSEQPPSKRARRRKAKP